MNYGIPYMGSKNKIAADIIRLLPEAGHFYDLFAGGCAVTQGACIHLRILDAGGQVRGGMGERRALYFIRDGQQKTGV